MFVFAPSAPVDLRKGDQLQTVSFIRRGDVVCFERVAENLVHLRALEPDEQAEYDGPMFRIDRGEEEGQMALKLMEPPTL